MTYLKQLLTPGRFWPFLHRVEYADLLLMQPFNALLLSTYSPISKNLPVVLTHKHLQSTTSELQGVQGQARASIDKLPGGSDLNSLLYFILTSLRIYQNTIIENSQWSINCKLVFCNFNYEYILTEVCVQSVHSQYAASCGCHSLILLKNKQKWLSMVAGTQNCPSPRSLNNIRSHYVSLKNHCACFCTHYKFLVWIYTWLGISCW